MYRAPLNSAPWRLVVLIASTMPLVVWAGYRWGGTGGSTAFCLFVVPVAAVALSGRPGWAVASALVASLGLYWEAFVSDGGSVGSESAWATLGAVSLSVMALVVARTVRVLRQQLSQHRQQLREFSHDWRDLKPTVISEPDAALFDAARTSERAHDEDRFDFPLLLLTLQDIGRRVSMNLDLDSLVQAILSTAKSSLDCTQCEVYLWDRAKRELVNPLPSLVDELQMFMPSADKGIGEWVLRERRILARTDLADDAEKAAAARSEPYVPEAVAPLVVGDDVLGLIVVDKVRLRSHNFIQMLYTLSSIYALGIKNAQLFRRVEEMALHDGLTGLYNHVTFQRKLRGLMREALVDETCFSLVMCDIDHFKHINDTCGHQAGDEVLRETARLWKAVMPADAVLARYGGEEFIAAIPGADSQKAAALAEYLREVIAEHPFLHEGHAMRVTASFGVAEFAGAAQTIDDIIREADQNLFAAKKAGRNRTMSRPRRPLMSRRRST